MNAQTKTVEELNTVGGRLRSALKSAGKKQRDLADHFGVTEQAVSQWFRNATGPDRDKIFALAGLLRVRPEWLLHGTLPREEPAAAKSNNVGDETLTARDGRQPDTRVGGSDRGRRGATNEGPEDLLKVLGMAEGGADGWNLFNGETVQFIPRPANLIGVPGAYAVYITNTSMIPRYRPGELAHIHPGKPVSPGDYVLVQRKPEHEGESPPAVVKLLVRRSASKIVLAQHNPEKEIEVKASEVLSIHRVVGSSEA